MKKSFFLSIFMVLMIVSMMAIPNKEKYQEIEDSDFSINPQIKINYSKIFPWDTKTNELALVNCDNYAPRNDGKIKLSIIANNSDNKKNILQEYKVIPSKSHMNFFISNMKDFNLLKGDSGIIKIESKSKNIECQMTYYTYDINDNISEIYSLNDSINGLQKIYFIYNPNSLEKNKIKKVSLFAQNVGENNLNLNIKSFNNKGKAKEQFSFSNIKKYEKQEINLTKTSVRAYEINADDENAKYFLTMKIIKKDGSFSYMPLLTTHLSNRVEANGNLILFNTSDEKKNTYFVICSKKTQCMQNKIRLGAKMQKKIDLTEYIKNLKSPILYIKSKDGSIASFVDNQNKNLILNDSGKMSGIDVVVPYNLSLGEKGTLLIFNEDKNRDVKVSMLVNSGRIKEYSIKKNSYRKININKIIDDNFAGYIYLSAVSPISAYMESVLDDKYKRVENGISLSNIEVSIN